MAMQHGSIGRGLLAGLAATIVVSLLMLLQQGLGFMPHVNPVMELANALGYRSAFAGWMAHFAIGVLAWGVLFTWFDSYLRRLPHWINGLLFSSIVWLGVMVIVLPAAGRGLFGTEGLALGTPTLTLVLNWIYGAVLGIVYGWLRPFPKAKRLLEASPRAHRHAESFRAGR
jgi:Family of unknown function (DUF6789)